MKKIFKFPIEHTPKQYLVMPKGAEILSVQVQNNSPFLYAMVNPNQTEKEERVFRIYATGTSINDDMGFDVKYIGTFIINDPQHPTGTFVGHLFEQL